MVKKPRIEFEIFDLAVYPHDVRLRAKQCPNKHLAIKMVRVFKGALKQAKCLATE